MGSAERVVRGGSRQFRGAQGDPQIVELRRRQGARDVPGGGEAVGTQSAHALNLPISRPSAERGDGAPQGVSTPVIARPPAMKASSADSTRVRTVQPPAAVRRMLRRGRMAGMTAWYAAADSSVPAQAALQDSHQPAALLQGTALRGRVPALHRAGRDSGGTGTARGLDSRGIDSRGIGGRGIDGRGGDCLLYTSPSPRD